MLMDLLMVKHEANIDNVLTFWFIYASETRPLSGVDGCNLCYLDLLEGTLCANINFVILMFFFQYYIILAYLNIIKGPQCIACSLIHVWTSSRCPCILCSKFTCSYTIKPDNRSILEGFEKTPILDKRYHIRQQ